ncbi:spore cortex biosynthesis protein YabQ [Caldalkalibacillus thermarum TA2.A1]|uniref:Spore cortex biosynthesis protein YabQ n=1 Tax=Caldalkalibacillus thermarum (strain TA2.A1) TaxID=986075 RepID=A0A8X8LBA5_CALTT|nr:spore cortex biosynthesis protein YabQ [Caldalkalibacillus thermarum]QZT34359.1 spore cortex biosynthesis protein YabQ [Caldalkalibacillus thermarum TA2.A1]
MSLDTQFLTMLHMIGAGLFLGASFDTYFRLRGPTQRSLVYMIQDVLFWLLNGMVVFLWLKGVNHGEVRLYIFVAIALGYAMYRGLFQTYYLRVLNATISAVLTVYRWTVKLLTLLVVRPLQFIFKVVVGVVVFTGGLIIGSGQFVFRLLRWGVLCLFGLGQKIWGLWTKHQPDDTLTDKADKKGKRRGLKKGFLSRMANKWLRRK